MIHKKSISLLRKRNMAIFDLLKKNKKKKEEVIYIEEKKDEEIILEKKEEVRSEINPDLDINSLYVSYNTLKNKLNSLYNEYYKCKIFSRVDLDDSENEKLEKDLDLYVDSLDSNVEEIEQSMTKCYSNDINEINRIYENIEKNNLAFKIINERIIAIIIAVQSNLVRVYHRIVVFHGDFLHRTSITRSLLLSYILRNHFIL